VEGLEGGTDEVGEGAGLESGGKADVSARKSLNEGPGVDKDMGASDTAIVWVVAVRSSEPDIG
jgi:hypothetical protein